MKMSGAVCQRILDWFTRFLLIFKLWTHKVCAMCAPAYVGMLSTRVHVQVRETKSRGSCKKFLYAKVKTLSIKNYRHLRVGIYVSRFTTTLWGLASGLIFEKKKIDFRLTQADKYVENRETPRSRPFQWLNEKKGQRQSETEKYFSNVPTYNSFEFKIRSVEFPVNNQKRKQMGERTCT